MPEAHKDLYTASRNSPRRTKPSPIPTAEDLTQTPQHRAILPMRPYAPRPTSTSTDTPAIAPPPSKRGRKPGPLSRTAREAQRRLNHSIIEKARRTKINDALATLRQLVPADYAQLKQTSLESRDENEDEDEDEDDYDEGTKKPKPKGKGTGKKEEKEKEFKLEILVRTVSFLQDLLQRVAALEANATPICNCKAGNPEPKKRKVDHLDEDQENPQAANRNAKIPRHSDRAPGSVRSETPDIAYSPVSISASVPPVSLPHTSHPTANDAALARLPSISSWLHNKDSLIDPQLLLSQLQPHSSPMVASYLPSPPSSAHFEPVRGSMIPPLLHLGPVATTAMINPTNRTPEDESAASLLLQIATSPTFHPMSSPPNYALSDPSRLSLDSEIRSRRDGHVRIAQTPSSLLGLRSTASSS